MLLKNLSLFIPIITCNRPDLRSFAVASSLALLTAHQGVNLACCFPGPMLTEVVKQLCSDSDLATHPPVLEPVREPNRCNLEPFNPETPKIALYLVLPQGRLTLQVVYLGLAHFRLPVRSPNSPSRRVGKSSKHTTS